MISPSQIGWGTYKGFEGPYFKGQIKYYAPQNPDFLDKVLAVITATEGGHLDAINMYDQCILTVGVIQYCEGVFLVSKLLGSCMKDNFSEVRSFLSQLPYPADVRRNSSNQWRFFFIDGGTEVNTKDMMRLMFLKKSPNLDKSQNQNVFTIFQKDHSKSVAAIMASMWEFPAMQQAQIDFTKLNLMSFVMKRSKDILAQNPGEDGWRGALKAAVASYSANLPAVADKWLFDAASNSAWSSATDEDRFRMAMKSVVFSPQIGIWPNRYKSISPVINRLFGVTVPTLDELKEYTGDGGEVCKYSESDIDSVPEIQNFLIKQGYDIGPSGADGVFGNKTKTAVIDFQSSHGLTPDGVVGPKTKEQILKVLGC